MGWNLLRERKGKRARERAGYGQSCKREDNSAVCEQKDLVKSIVSFTALNLYNGMNRIPLRFPIHPNTLKWELNIHILRSILLSICGIKFKFSILINKKRTKLFPRRCTIARQFIK